MTTMLQKDLATRAGRMAARTGQPLQSCPYDPDGDGLQKMLALAFVRGWLAGETPTVEVIKSASMYDPQSPPDDSGEWVWVEDEILKYESWWPRDARGRWVKRSHLTAAVNEGKSLVEALLEESQRHRRPVAKLRKGEVAHVAGLDRYGQTISGAGFVQGVGRFKTRKGGERLGVDLAEYPDGLGGWRMTVFTDPDATTGRPEPQGVGLADPPGDADPVRMKRAELEQARRELEANFNRHAGTSRLRGKQHGIRIDAQIRRAAQLDEKVRRLERELEGLQRPEQKQKPSGPLDLSRLPQAKFIRTRHGWYEVVKVNRSTVKVKAEPGMNDLIKVPKIVEFWVEGDPDPDIGKAATTGDPGAGGAGPKAQTPPPDQRWPGWEQDLAIAAAVAAHLTASMSGAITSAHRSAIVAAFLAWARAWRAGQPLPDVGGWLRASTQVRQRIAEAIGEAIRGGWAQGYMAGTRSADAVLAAVAADGPEVFARPPAPADGEPPRPAVQITVDWGQWKPGDVAAARRIMAEDGSIEPFEQLLRDFGHTIERIAANRLDEIAAVLADGLEQGRTPKEIAEALTGVVNDRVWARKVAITETNRAMSAAALDTYTAADVAATSWMTALDQRVCPICFNNEFEADGVTVRVVPVGQRYPSGDYHPPGHPHCRCTPIPALLNLLKAYNPNQPRDRRGRWTRRAGVDWAARIASGITKREQLSDEGNYSKVELHHFGDGSKAVYKTGKVWEGDDQPLPMRDEHDAEELAAAVARVLGLEPPDVHRINDDEAYFEYVEDATLAAATSDPNKVVEDSTLAAATGDPDIAGARLDAHRIGLLDVLTENLDRNATNWFIRFRPDENWQLIPIDNALAWEAGRSFYGGRSPSEIASPTDPFAYLFARQSSARGLDGEWIDTHLSPEYVRALRPKLEALKPEFERLGHGGWHERMMVRLIHVEHRAKGDLHL